MNALAFRHFYDYHFNENRKIWDAYITSLSPEQFTQNVSYSHGSVRNQIVHILRTDEAWFSSLRGDEFPEPFDPSPLDGRGVIRTHWDVVEQNMRDYLSKLGNAQLLTKPFAEGEDKDLFLWQVLIHVVNHGTDHRAQLLRLLNDYGIQTGPQDYIFYAYDHL